jgi:hypothetical protein
VLKRLELGLLALVFAVAARGQVSEYQAKAAFLYNVTKFVEWPSQSFRAAGEPLVVCILGENPFGESLEDAVRGKKIGSRPVIVRYVVRVSECDDCHVLFVSASERRRLRTILGAFRSSAVLTVGDTDGFAGEGGVVNFCLEGGRIRIEVNVDAAERAKLRISAKLLSLASIVRR